MTNAKIKFVFFFFFLITVYYEDIFNFSNQLSGDDFSVPILQWEEVNLGICYAKSSILAGPKH